MADLLLGHTDQNDYNDQVLNTIYGHKAVAVASGTLTDLYIVFRATGSGGNMRIGVYADNGSTAPGALLLDAGVVSIAAGTQTIGGLSLAITNGVTYWLATLGDTTTGQLYIKTGMGAGAMQWAAQSYGALPNPFPAIASTTTYNGQYYGMGTLSGGVAYQKRVILI